MYMNQEIISLPHENQKTDLLSTTPPGVIKALYFESKRLNQPMTRVAADILTRNLQSTPGWHKAREEMEIE